MTSIASKLPKDFKMVIQAREQNFRSNTVTITCTMQTTYEADAVIAALQIMRDQLSSHREAVAADFGIEEPVEPPFLERFTEVFG